MTDILLAASCSLATELAGLVDTARGYAADALAANTRKAYAADWKKFEGWCQEHGLPSLPATPAAVATYLAHLASTGMRTSTVERALAGIGHAHRASGVPWEPGSPVVRDVLAGICRRHGVAPHKKTPVKSDELQLLAATLGGSLRHTRNRALLTLGWFCAARRSEIVALDVENIAFVTEGLIVHIERSKSDQVGRGYSKGVPFAGDPAVCPVRALRAWLDATGIVEGPLFRSVNKGGRISGSRLSANDVARIVKELSKRAGLDPAKLAGHSLRSGFMTTAAKRKKSLAAIMRQSNHRSVPIALEYMHDATMFEDNAAAGLV